MVRIFSTHFNSDNFRDNSKINAASGSDELIFNYKSEPLMYKFDNDPPSKKRKRVYDPVDQSWKKTFADYTPSNQAKYNKVREYVKAYAKHQGNRTADIDALTNMFCKLSDDYGLDPEITAVVIGHETGGFVFSPENLAGRDDVKGVCQAKRPIIDAIYASYEDRKNKSLSPEEIDLAYDNWHLRRDMARIIEIKEKYPTPDDLWKALETDVVLGVEVGIMAFKMKLDVKGGNTKAALAGYCGNQYFLPPGATMKMQYELPLPKYKRTTTEIVEEGPYETNIDKSMNAETNTPEVETLSQADVDQILLDSMELKSHMNDEEKEEYNAFVSKIKYKEDGSVDIEDEETLDVISYLKILLSEIGNISEEDDEKLDF